MLKTCTLESLYRGTPAMALEATKQPDKHMREAIKHTHARIEGAVESHIKVRAKVRKPVLLQP